MKTTTTSSREDEAFTAAMVSMDALCEARYEFWRVSGRRYNRLEAEVCFERLVIAEEAKNAAYAEWDASLAEARQAN